jgi:hypothetical protein
MFDSIAMMAILHIIDWEITRVRTGVNPSRPRREHHCPEWQQGRRVI